MRLADYSQDGAYSSGCISIFHRGPNGQNPAPHPPGRGARRHIFFSFRYLFQEMVCPAYGVGRKCLLD